MIKIFKTEDIKHLDALTMEKEPVSSFDLMKRAVKNMMDEMLPLVTRDTSFTLLAGPGNNGGDALVLARNLLILGFHTEVFLFNPKNKLSTDCYSALNEFETAGGNVTIVCNDFNPNITHNTIVIDGLFGSGLSRPLDGIYAQAVQTINCINAVQVWAIDIPSGLMGEDNSQNTSGYIIKATHTFTFQQPKLAFLLPENETYIGSLHVIDIKIHPEAIEQTPTNLFLTTAEDIKLHHRKKFSHKGSFGHALLVAGKYGMAGAAILAAKSCLKTGCGLISVHAPSKLVNIIQISFPEAILDIDDDENEISSIKSVNKYSAIGIGPGIGTGEKTAMALEKLLNTLENKHIVLDADALNIIANNKHLITKLPPETIITPHPKEFDRLCGTSHNGYERLHKAISFSANHQLIIVLKGAYSAVVFPNKKVYFNTTGNNGMATAGSGDVLTGIILSLLTQNYTPQQAALYGTYIHGLAGDLYANEISEESLLASDIFSHIGLAIKSIKAKQN